MRAKKKRKREEKEKTMFLVLRRSMQLAHQWRRWSLISSALNKSIAAAQKELERVQKTRTQEQKKFSREEIKEIIDRTRKNLNKE